MYKNRGHSAELLYFCVPEDNVYCSVLNVGEDVFTCLPVFIK